jgi:hypothetical protein
MSVPIYTGSVGWGPPQRDRGANEKFARRVNAGVGLASLLLQLLQIAVFAVFSLCGGFHKLQELP